jgi:nucleoside-diphosphate-sugar epimerase
MTGILGGSSKIQGTGLSGTIGKHLKNTTNDLQINLSAPVKLYKNSRFNPSADLIHLAGIVGESNVRSNPQQAKRVNVNAVIELGQEYLAHGEGTFLYVSSSHVYAPLSSPIREKDPVGPTSLYANQKLEAETALQSIFIDQPTRLCIIRVFSVLDWGCPVESLGGAIRALVESPRPRIVRYSRDVRDFLTPSLIGKTLIEIAETGASGIYNLCSSEPLTIRAATKKMLQSRGFESDGVIFEESHSPRPYLVGDNSKLRSLLPHTRMDWSPSVTGEL